MEKQQQQSEALRLADIVDRLNVGVHSQAIFEDYSAAVRELRRLHARVEELKKDLGNAKRLASKIWDKHPEAHGTIEEGTGAWMVFGQDVETSVSAQRVTQAADHIVQDRKIVAAPKPQADGRDAELLDWLEGEVRNSYTGVTITRIDHREDGMVIERGFRLRRFHKDYEVKPTLRAAIAAAKESR